MHDEERPTDYAEGYLPHIGEPRPMTVTWPPGATWRQITPPPRGRRAFLEGAVAFLAVAAATAALAIVARLLLPSGRVSP